jgi:hypothetical protein
MFPYSFSPATIERTLSEELDAPAKEVQLDKVITRAMPTAIRGRSEDKWCGERGFGTSMAVSLVPARVKVMLSV